MCANPLKNPLSGLGLAGMMLGGNKKKVVNRPVIEERVMSAPAGGI